MDTGEGAQSKTERYELLRPVFLIGFMGAGKSTVARRFARMCKTSALDLDSYIERKAGMKVKEIFAESGEAGFRKLETEALRNVSLSEQPSVVSCGGGVICTECNIEIMREHGYVVHLMVDAKEAASRISDLSTRPLFENIEAASRRCNERMPIYNAAANATIDTKGKDPYVVSKELRRLLLKEGVLCKRQE